MAKKKNVATRFLTKLLSYLVWERETRIFNLALGESVRLAETSINLHVFIAKWKAKGKKILTLMYLWTISMFLFTNNFYPRKSAQYRQGWKIRLFTGKSFIRAWTFEETVKRTREVLSSFFFLSSSHVLLCLSNKKTHHLNEIAPASELTVKPSFVFSSFVMFISFVPYVL